MLCLSSFDFENDASILYASETKGQTAFEEAESLRSPRRRSRTDRMRGNETRKLSTLRRGAG